ncbi:MAG: hypothetical protein QOE05_212 [Actinomycetota bacterium]|jgi:hypothetical protein|nr:hypothetical protein [Actinomycetota bacterium]
MAEPGKSSLRPSVEAIDDMGEFMTAVRRVLVTAGLAGVLLLPTGSAWAADPTPSADPSVSPTASADPSATPAPTESPAAEPGTEPSAEPTAGGCEQNPVICQSGGAPGSTVDCGQVGPGGEAASPPPPGVICIASGLNPGNPNEVTQVSSGSGSGAPGTLPRTGPAPLVPTLLLGSWLLLIGVVAALTGRRRTAKV